MKAKKILFLIAGVFNCILGGLGVLIGGFGFLFSGIIRNTFESSTELIEEYINSLVKADESLSYLKDYSTAEAIDYVIKLVLIVCAVLLVLGLIYVAFGVFNLIFSKNYAIIMSRKKYLGVLLVVFSWLLLWFNIANILTTVAICLKYKNNTNTKLYSARDNV